jgi:uncharacterized membrane protein
MNLYLAILFWLHLVAITLWLGGSLLLPLAIQPALLAVDPPARGKFMAAFSKRFASMAMIAIAVVIVTGILQTGQLYGFAYLMGINVLVIKIITAVIMIANGVYIGMVLSRRSQVQAPALGQPPSPEFLKTMRSLAVHGWVQAGLSVFVLFLVGLLTA